MGIIGAYAVPHPPLIVPAVGKGMEKGIAATVAAYEQVAHDIVAAEPDTLIVLSSHAPAYRNGFYVSNTAEFSASMADFGAPHERFSVRCDRSLAIATCAVAHHADIPTCGYAANNALDHASFIPLWFIRNAMFEAQESLASGMSGTGEPSGATFPKSPRVDTGELPPIVSIGLSWLPFEMHRAFGNALARAIEESGRRAVIIASGDLSHRLLAEGPYGFRAEGPEFDARITDIFSRGALEELFDIDSTLADRAGECGLRPFMILAGALDGHALDARLLSYEGPYGVGYAIASFIPQPEGEGEIHG